MQDQTGKKTKELLKEGLKDKGEALAVPEPTEEELAKEAEAKARVAEIKKTSVGGFPSASMNVIEDDGA
ncbi:MAG: hypothetical protein JNK63_02450 [Chthonomonas sp.]|nr:hypothetical protein [Chthonomonas sp.]